MTGLRLMQVKTDSVGFGALGAHPINDEPEWHDTFDYDLSFHMRYICDENDPYKMSYKRTRDLLEQEKKAHCGTPKN
jgi:hypothetical protein